MRVLRASSKFVFTASVVAGLVACGGGGGGGGGGVVSSGGGAVTSSISPSSPAPYTQATANTTAGLGLLIVEADALQVVLEQGFFAGLLQSFVNTSVTGSEVVTMVPCAQADVGSGTLARIVTKAGAYPGLLVNDTISYTFDNCTLGTSPFNFNGTVTISPTVDYSTGVVPLLAAFRVDFKAVTTDFDVTFGVAKYRSSGMQTVVWDGTAAGIEFPEISVIAGLAGYNKSRFNPYTSTLPSTTANLRSGGTIYTKLSSGDLFVSGVNGEVDVGAAGVATQSYTLATTPRLSGSDATGRDVPIAGVLRAKNNTLNLQTVTTINGLDATVQADTNRDGVLDSSAVVSVSSLIN